MSSWDAMENSPTIYNQFSTAQQRELELMVPVLIAEASLVRASTPEDVLYYTGLLKREFARLTPTLKSTAAALFPANTLSALGVQECTLPPS